MSSKPGSPDCNGGRTRTAAEPVSKISSKIDLLQPTDFDGGLRIFVGGAAIARSAAAAHARAASRRAYEARHRPRRRRRGRWSCHASHEGQLLSVTGRDGIDGKRSQPRDHGGQSLVMRGVICRGKERKGGKAVAEGGGR